MLFGSSDPEDVWLDGVHVPAGCHPGVGEGQGEVVLPGADVAVALGAGLLVLIQDLGVGGHVPGELGDGGRLSGQDEPLVADGLPGGVQGLGAVHLDDLLSMLPGGCASLVLVEVVHEHEAAVALGELPRLVGLRKAVDDARLDVVAGHEGVEVIELRVGTQVDDVLPLPVVAVLAEHDHVELPARIDAHGVGFVSGHGRVGAQRQDRHHVQPALEVGPGDTDLEVVEALREARPVFLEDLARVDLAAERLGDAVVVDRPARGVGRSRSVAGAALSHSALTAPDSPTSRLCA